MKEVILLSDGWEITQYKPIEKLNKKEIEQLSNTTSLQDNEWFKTKLPAQVHEILISYDKIKDPSVTLDYEACLWVTDCDWIYRGMFKNSKGSEKTYLYFKGLDTLVDIYLNGEHIAYHDNMFLPLRVDVTDKIKDENILLLHFHSVFEYMKHLDICAKWQGKIESKKFLRKAPEDVGDFLGAKPYLAPVGVFDTIEIEHIDVAEISYINVDYELSSNYESADLALEIEGNSFQANIMLEIEVVDPYGRVAEKLHHEVKGLKSENWKANLTIALDHIKLWWPRGYGDQPLYEIITKIYVQGSLKDSKSKKIGFRDIKMVGPFDYLINDKKVKLWGVNLVSIDGITHCWNQDRAFQLLDLAQNCHSNTIRVWGGAEPHSEKLYDECDRRGILVWFEFYHIWGMYPDSDEFREKCRLESTYIVKKLRHHSSILLWCGGNENFMGTECDSSEESYIGTSIFKEDYKKVCNTLDPKRYYHINSPFGGDYTNDPLQGDTHGYTHVYYVPEADYPVMLSENTRISIPVLRSMKKAIGEDKLWPESYSSMVCSPDEMPLPESWHNISTGGILPRIKNIEKFYDAKTPEGLIYKFGAARSLHLRETVERCRRGRSSQEPLGERRCKGHYMWKFNDTWPQVCCSMLDYYLEPYMPYYALKRAHVPLLLSFDVENSIYLWVVNDTAKYSEGTLVFQLFDMDKNKVISERSSDVIIPQGESRVIMDLNYLGQFNRHFILFAYYRNRNGEIIARTNEILDIERNMKFPHANLELKCHEDILEITSDQFARCIELTGNEDGNEFGWIFEDNYFDLLPGEIKKVKIMGAHKKGIITAKPYYSSSSSIIIPKLFA